MSCDVYEIDPLDVNRRATIDYSQWLGTGSTIVSASWTVPTGLQATGDSVSSPLAINYFTPVQPIESEYEVAVTATTNDSVPRSKTYRFLVRVEEQC